MHYVYTPKGSSFSLSKYPKPAYFQNIEKSDIPLTGLHLKQGSRGRRIQRPGTIKLDSGRIKMLRTKSQDANFFSCGTTENCDQNNYCLLGFEV